MTILYVGIAGMAGVLARYGISSAFHGDSLPWATAAINIAGSFALGMLVVAHSTSEEFRTAAGVGFLGGFTTYSTFAVQGWLDIEAGEPGKAFIYLAVSVIGGLAAAAGGFYLGRAVL